MLNSTDNLYYTSVNTEEKGSESEGGGAFGERKRGGGVRARSNFSYNPCEHS